MSRVVRPHVLISTVALILGLAGLVASWMRVVHTQEPGGWVFCANENETCAFTGTRQVRYGAAGRYAYVNATDGTPCTNAVFGDPAPNLAKHCDSKETPGTPPPRPEPRRVGEECRSRCSPYPSKGTRRRT